MRVSHFTSMGPRQTGGTRRRVLRAVGAIAGLALIATGTAACSDDSAPQSQKSTSTVQSDAPTPEQTEPDPKGTTEQEPIEPTPTPEVPDVPQVDVTAVDVVAQELASPWGLAQLPDGNLLVTFRQKAQLVRLDRRTGEHTVLTGPGAVELEKNTRTTGEGGLLGLALSPEFDQNNHVFVYRTTEDGNEVLRGTINADNLSALDVVIDAIPTAATHNGGALAFGPDGQLYIGTGDAGTPTDAQDINALAGKILRIAPDGAIPTDNPMPGLPVWSTGHRDVQGFSWDENERMYAAELGGSDVDELNVIRAGGNYGWPQYQGSGGKDDGFDDPLKSWPTAVAAPGGVAITSEGIYLAALNGLGLWRVPLAQVVSGEPLASQVLLEGEYGRLRNVLALAGGDLLVLTNNVDSADKSDVGESDNPDNPDDVDEPGGPNKKEDLLLRLKVTPTQRTSAPEPTEPTESSDTGTTVPTE